jgi:hypothetical protein
MDAAAAGALSRADFDPSPSAFKTRAGDVAAIRRRPNGPSERWPGPRISAETKIAWADHPGGWIGWLGKRLGLGGARLRKDAQRENSGRERGCGFCHVETLRSRGACRHRPLYRIGYRARFKSARSAQKFLSTHTAVFNTFNVQRYLTSARTHRMAFPALG